MALKLDKSRLNLESLAETIARTSGSQIESVRPLRFDDLKITTKDSLLVPFAPNNLQSRFNDHIYNGKDWRNAPPELTGCREVILKSRQMGFSTDILAALFCDTYQNPNRNTVIVAHDRDSTVNLFSRVKLMFEHLPIERKMAPQYASKYEYYWPQINSRFLVGTAGTEEFGRSWTIHNCLLSEVPSWPSVAKDTFTSLLQAIPFGGNVFIESTAKGMDEMFYPIWTEAEAGNSVFQPHFYSWKDFAEYRLPESLWARSLPPKRRDMNALDEEEQRIAETYDLDLEQLAWRRMKLGEPGMNHKKFRQEYPLSSVESFLATGESYFDDDLLNELNMLIESHPNYDGLTKELSKGLHIPLWAETLRNFKDFSSATEPGTFEMWELPQPGVAYAVIADVIEGLDRDGKHDFAAVDVFRLDTWEQVAHLHLTIPAPTLGRLLTELGYWYNTATLIPERNNHGHATIGAIENETAYPFGVDGLWRDKDDKFGWLANERTKAIGDERLKRMLADGSIKVNCKGTLKELMSYVEKKGGKREARSGANDDRVTTLRIAACVLPDLCERLDIGSEIRSGGQAHFYSSPKTQKFVPDIYPTLT